MHVQSCCFANLTYCLFAVLIAVVVVVAETPFWNLETRFSGRCRSREVWTRVNVRIVRWETKETFV